jgi:hypothetical protein
MRTDIVPGGTFPDYELPDHENVARKLSDIRGDDPLILTLARGHYCPMEHQQHLELAAFYPKLTVASTRIATISNDPHHTSQEFPSTARRGTRLAGRSLIETNRTPDRTSWATGRTSQSGRSCGRRGQRGRLLRVSPKQHSGGRAGSVAGHGKRDWRPASGFRRPAMIDAEGRVVSARWVTVWLADRPSWRAPVARAPRRPRRPRRPAGPTS